jgi:hypothetical protein
MAILFDADNVPARLAGVILEEIHRQVPGVSIDRRVYGDFSSPRNEPWKTAALQLGIEPRMATSPSRMKNATDIALVIGAMDILHESDARSVVDTFVLVTNDSDFAPLAQRLRRSGKRVVAVGTGSTLITSCDCFISIDYTRMPSAVSDSSHVRTLVGLAYDLSLGSGGDSSAVVNPFADGAWISVGTLAQHIDRQQPGWRLARMEGFVNFRHMLETEPWRSAFELRLGPTSVGELQGMASGAASGAADSLQQRRFAEGRLSASVSVPPAPRRTLRWPPPSPLPLPLPLPPLPPPPLLPAAGATGKWPGPKPHQSKPHRPRRTRSASFVRCFHRGSVR